MKTCKIICLLLVYSFDLNAQQADYSKIVNPFIGTGGHGHTFPGATAPFGMVQLSPDTRLEGWDGCSGYHYSDSVIYGFSHTHLSGTGCSDYGDVMIMPVMGETSFDNTVYASKFSHAKEKAHAGYYSVHLDDDDIDVELTATTRVGFHQYTFNRSGKVNFIIDLLHRDKLLDGKIRITDNKTIEGFRRSEAWAKDQRLYFRIEFSKEFLSNQIIKKDTVQSKASFTFDVKQGQTILVKVSVSAVDNDGAKNNMQKELPGWDFEKTKRACENLWNKELNKIQVKGGTINQQIIFYTALYHAFIQPNVYSDADGRYLGRDMKIHQADSFTYYSVFSLWDTFRAAHPLYNIVQRKRNSDFIKTFLKQYEQGGRLPVWELSSNETDCMIAYHSVSVITDAYAKGIRDFDLKLASEAMQKSASWNHQGLPTYIKNGYLSCEDENESVSKTLEYAYDDWCISQFCEEKSKKIFDTRSQSWKNLFDRQTGFMRPRKNGGWWSPFNPSEVNNNYTEANAWQYSFFVPHDIEGLVKMHGGNTAFERKLDDLFSTSSKIDGRQQADISGMIGQYAHGNEPSHHMAYLYNYIGRPSKTQFRVHQILTALYKNAPDGLAGNEDCGQMSAWYVMSAIGLYPVCPGNDEYQVTTPLFDEVSIHSGDHLISIKAPHAAEENYYISSVKINGAIVSNSTIKHELFNGSPAINFTLTDQPIDAFQIAVSNKKTEDHYIPAPVIDAEKKTFKDSLLITIHSFAQGGKVNYIVTYKNITETTLDVKKYTKPFYIYETANILAISVDENGKQRNTSQGTFYRILHNLSIQLHTKYSPQYTAGGNDAVIDGIHGDTNWRKGNWQGYWGNDFEAVIDLGKEQNISEITAGFLQDTRAWIMMPAKIEYLLSEDGKNFKNIGTLTTDIDPKNYQTLSKNFIFKPSQKQKARFVKVTATNFGKLPAWHENSGENAWLFIDEVEVK